MIEVAPWAAEAACAGLSTALFFPPEDAGPGHSLSRRDLSEARRVCAECPVRAECLEWAIERGERYGVWGGLTAVERAKERRRRRRKPAGSGDRKLSRISSD